MAKFMCDLSKYPLILTPMRKTMLKFYRYLPFFNKISIPLCRFLEYQNIVNTNS